MTDSFHEAVSTSDVPAASPRSSSRATRRSELPLTPWFPYGVKPVRKGVYEVKGRLDVHGHLLYSSGYAWWDGSQWGYSYGTPYVASMDGKSQQPNFATQTKVWRGLAGKPQR